MNAQRGQEGLLPPDSVLHRAAERLAQQFARDRLVALAQSRGMIGKPVPEILYVCVQNSGRSQMAADLDLDGIRTVRDGIRQHVQQLLTELTPDLTAHRS
ncbi:hypothetical protein [Microbacterium aurum]